MIPPWAVVIIVIIFIIFLLSLYYVFKKRFSNRSAVGTLNEDEKFPDIYEKPQTIKTINSSTCQFTEKIEIDSDYPISNDNFVSVNIEPTEPVQQKTPLQHPPPLDKIFVDENDVQPETAARQAIRSASRKSRTRSMIVTDESSVFTNKIPDISTYATLRATPPSEIYKSNERKIKKPIEHLFNIPTEIVPKKPSETESAKNPDTVSIESSQTAIQDSTLPRNDVGTIRRMLQSSWSGNQLKSSESSSTLSGDSIRPVLSPVGSVNPRLQNQHLVSLSIRNTTRQRPSILGYMEVTPPSASLALSATNIINQENEDNTLNT